MIDYSSFLRKHRIFVKAAKGQSFFSLGKELGISSGRAQQIFQNYKRFLLYRYCQDRPRYSDDQFFINYDVHQIRNEPRYWLEKAWQAFHDRKRFQLFLVARTIVDEYPYMAKTDRTYCYKCGSEWLRFGSMPCNCKEGFFVNKPNPKYIQHFPVFWACHKFLI